MRSSLPSLTVAELAQYTGALLRGAGGRIVTGVADLEEATPSDVSFFANPRYKGKLGRSQAAAIFLSDPSDAPAEVTLLIHPDPSAAFQSVLEGFFSRIPLSTGFEGIHPTAVIHPTAKIASGVTVAPYAVIDAYVQVGEGCFIGPHAYIGPECQLGVSCFLHAHVILREGSKLGNRVILQPGAVVGSCGFGYLTSGEGKHGKLLQLGWVELGDDVEIGANATVDRGRFKATRIGEGSKIDNLVQIAHGVQIGAHALIAAQSGIAGSTKLGNHVTVGGQVAIAGHLEIASTTVIAGKSGVSKSLAEGVYSGIPVQPIGEYNRMAVLCRKLPQLWEQVESLMQRVTEGREGEGCTKLDR